MKTSHDKQDLVELPKFINFACDMGLIGDPDNIRTMSPQAELPHEQKAPFSNEPPITKETAKPTELKIMVFILL